MPLRSAAVLALAVALLAPPTSAQSGGTPAKPVANPLFQDTRVITVNLTFTPQEFAALRPVHVAGGGSRESWLQGAEGHRNGLSASRGLEFPYVHATATVDGRTVRDIGVRYKGNGTFNLGQQVNKTSFKLDLNHYVKGQRLSGVKTLNLHSNVTDASYTNEVLAFRAFRAAGVPAPRTAYARVTITVPGRYTAAYYGLFSLTENPDEPFVVDRGLPGAGAIFKPVTGSLFRDLGHDWARYNQTYDPKTPLTPQQKQRVMDFAGIVTSGTDAQFAAAADQYLDLDNAARFLAVTTWLSDLDGILGSGQNYYVYLDPRTNRFSFMAWDQDHSFGQFFTGSQRQREQLNIHRPWNGSNRFLERLFRVDAFKSRYLNYLDEFSRTILSPDVLAREVDEIAALIRPAVREESAERLSRLEKTVAGQAAPVDDGMFAGANVPIKPFARARAESVRQQLGR
jgi:spore coat protein CotH